MEFVKRTRVAAPPAAVMAGMDRALLERITPPFPRARLLRFEGSHTGAEVHIRLHFGLFSTVWHSRIISETHGPHVWEFVDEGTRLPFFLTAWRHAHRMLPHPTGTVIEDAVTFRTPWWLPAPLMWLGLWAMFTYRGPGYRGRFGRVGGGISVVGKRGNACQRITTPY